MMYEQQVRELCQELSLWKNKSDHEQNRGQVEEEQRLHIVDLSGLSLDSLPSPSLNLATICKLDLSNNNLQVRTYIYIFSTNLNMLKRYIVLEKPKKQGIIKRR